MKDLYDLWHILGAYELQEDVMRQAIAKTFQRRGTLLEAEPSAFTDVFWTDPSKRAQWSAFLRRNDLQAADLENVVKDVAERLAPLMPI